MNPFDFGLRLSSAECPQGSSWGIFPDMDDILSKSAASGYAMDDAFDALVAAWTAGQTVLGKAETMPENPKLDSKGLRMEILHPAGYN